ncbi:MAG: S1-like domain-containing RNA-binding protein [Clostridiales bacterium]|nr:S1-like domain-containing RNA-binding protein [Clostridiales bacterium]
MLNIGKVNSLKIVRESKIGLFLEAENSSSEINVLLPSSEVKEGLKVGDAIDVFVYKDSMGRLTATFLTPFGQVGELAYLEVVDNTKIGAFLKWGLSKDVLLPIKEQTCSLKRGKKYLVKIYLDKSERICTSMKIDLELDVGKDFTAGDMVEGIVYGKSDRLGIFVAIEDKYLGFVHNSENFKDYRIGDKGKFRVIKIREDGKVDLSTRQVAHMQMDDDAEELLNLLIINHGSLPLNDKSSPDEIRNYLPISKNSFKRALGRLLKEKKVAKTESGIRLIKEIE